DAVEDEVVVLLTPHREVTAFEGDPLRSPAFFMDCDSKHRLRSSRLHPATGSGRRGAASGPLAAPARPRSLRGAAKTTTLLLRGARRRARPTLRAWAEARRPGPAMPRRTTRLVLVVPSVDPR